MITRFYLLCLIILHLGCASTESSPSDANLQVDEPVNNGLSNTSLTSNNSLNITNTATSNNLSNPSLNNTNSTNKPSNNGLNQTLNATANNAAPSNAGGLGNASLNNLFSPSTEPIVTETTNPINLPGKSNSASTGNAVVSTTVVPPPANTIPTNAVPAVNTLSSNAAPAPLANATIPPPEAPVNTTVEHVPAKAEITQMDLDAWKQAAQKLRNLTADESPQEYIVQPGDTLWDICDQLLDNQYWWPKLWTLNASITNPHLILPGQKLVFYASDGISEPALLVRDIGQATPISPDSILLTKTFISDTNNWTGKEDVLLNASEIASDPNLESIGYTANSDTFNAMIPGYLSSDEPKSLGEIVDVADSRVIMGKGRTAYAEFDSPPQPGQKYLTVRSVRKGRNPNGDELDGPDLYLYTGVVGVVKQNKSGVTTLIVEDSNIGVGLGDVLVPFRNIFVQVNPQAAPRVAQLKAEILAMGEDVRGLTHAGYSVFLERQEGTVNVGDDIDIYMPAGGAFNFSADKVDGVLAGKARVMDITEESIVAMVLSSKIEISIGARTWPDFE